MPIRDRGRHRSVPAYNAAPLTRVQDCARASGIGLPRWCLSLGPRPGTAAGRSGRPPAVQGWSGPVRGPPEPMPLLPHAGWGAACLVGVPAVSAGAFCRPERARKGSARAEMRLTW